MNEWLKSGVPNGLRNGRNWVSLHIIEDQLLNDSQERPDLARRPSVSMKVGINLEPLLDGINEGWIGFNGPISMRRGTTTFDEVIAGLLA